MARLDEDMLQEEYLATLRNTGRFGRANKGIGLSDRAVQNFREKHKDFDNACKLAKAVFDTRKRIRLDVQMGLMAHEELKRRIKERTITDGALIALRRECLNYEDVAF